MSKRVRSFKVWVVITDGEPNASWEFGYSVFRTQKEAKVEAHNYGGKVTRALLAYEVDDA